MSVAIWSALLLALAGAEPVAEGSLVVGYQGQTERVERSAFALPPLPVPDEDKVEALTEKLDRRFRTEPQDAVLNRRGDIVPDQPGYRLDRRAFDIRFRAYFYGTGGAVLEAPMYPVRARVDTELLAEIREKPIGAYVTYYSAGNAGRSHNIALAARAIDNTVIFPGETFSFNRTVGKRTEARGYRRAPVIVRGELAEDIGGGICQVSSTLFNAVDRAGLRVLQRYSHSRTVPYVLPGRDATVSWNGPDFTFRNPYDEPVLIRASAGGGRILVRICSSEAIRMKPRNVPPVSG